MTSKQVVLVVMRPLRLLYYILGGGLLLFCILLLAGGLVLQAAKVHGRWTAVMLIGLSGMPVSICLIALAGTKITINEAGIQMHYKLRYKCSLRDQEFSWRQIERIYTRRLGERIVPASIELKHGGKIMIGDYTPPDKAIQVMQAFLSPETFADISEMRRSV